MAKSKTNIGGFSSTETGTDPETGAISWDITYKPNYGLIYKAFRDLNKEFKKFLEFKETANDPEFKKIYNGFNYVWNAFRTHIRKNYPGEYKQLKSLDEQRLKELVQGYLKEMSATGAGPGALISFK